jgi:hypothetical protein
LSWAVRAGAAPTARSTVWTTPTAAEMTARGIAVISRALACVVVVIEPASSN